jgi:hypothetical protein
MTPPPAGGCVSAAPQRFLWPNRMLVYVTLYTSIYILPSPQRRAHPGCECNATLRLHKFGWPARHNPLETVREPIPARLPLRAMPRSCSKSARIEGSARFPPPRYETFFVGSASHPHTWSAALHVPLKSRRRRQAAFLDAVLFPPLQPAAVAPGFWHN